MICNVMQGKILRGQIWAIILLVWINGSVILHSLTSYSLANKIGKNIYCLRHS